MMGSTPARPDYGTYLMGQGVDRQVEQHFHGCWIDRFTMLGIEEGMTTLTTITRGADEFAASFDISWDLWVDFLSALPPALADEIARGLDDIDALPHTVEFPEPCRIGMAARIGEPQVGTGERFVPLVVERIWTVDRR